MFDVVIPYTKSNTSELKYALRSIDKFVPHRNVIIVGDRPKFNVIHVPFEDFKLKNHSMYRKILKACEGDLTEKFYYWHDDHFALKPIDNLPAYYNKTLKDWHEKLNAGRERNGRYQRYIAKVMSIVGENANYYDIHTPCLIEKSKVAELEKYDWKEDMIFKSLYLNLFPQPSEFMSDLKLNHNGYSYQQLKGAITNRTFFSTGEWSMTKPMLKLLNELYPEKSKYEL